MEAAAATGPGPTFAQRARAAVPDEAALRRWLWIVLAVGLVLRLLLAATTAGSLGDLLAFRAVRGAIANDLFGFYSAANPEPGRFAWPYLPGFLPILEAVWRLAEATGLSFDRLIRLPAIAADLAIAWLVQWHLGWRGALPWQRLAAASLVALGPIGIAFTGAHGQIDPLEWVPAILALIAWERLDGDRRAIVAGLLVGIGVSIKPPAALVGVALFALSANWRERILLVGAGALLPLLITLPFLLVDPDGTLTILDYQSVPGQGGLSMLIQPDLALARFAGREFEPLNGTQRILQDLAPVLVGLSVAFTAFVAWRRKADAPSTVCALMLATFVVSPNFLPPYGIWLVGVAVLSGWWRFLLAFYALSLVVLPFKYLPASVIGRTHLGPGGDLPLFHQDVVAAVYVPFGALMWALMAWQLVRWLRYGAAVS